MMGSGKQEEPVFILQALKLSSDFLLWTEFSVTLKIGS